MAGSRRFSAPIAFVQRDIPKGTIFLWHGAIEDIPITFNLCNGKRHTPDLRNYFVPAAGPARPVNDTGGNLTHAHAFTTDGVSHAFAGPTGLGAGANFSFATPADTDTGTTNIKTLVQPFRALSYIMYLGCKR